MNATDRFSWQFPAIGTQWRISTPEPLEDTVIKRVDDCIEEFDQHWSRFRHDSLVAKLAHAGGSVPLPMCTDEMFQLYRELTVATKSAVTPLIGGSLVALGYDAEYSFASRGAEPVTENWMDVLRWDDAYLSTEHPVTIDIGAIGKGKLVDLVAELFDVSGVSDYLIDAGGDIRVRGSEVRAALEHPYDATQAIGIVTLRDTALCASATNRRSWGDGLHHVLDARTGLPVETIIATWVWGVDALLADGIATALFFPGGRACAEAMGCAWVVMYTDGRVQHSAHPTLDLFTSLGEEK